MPTSQYGLGRKGGKSRSTTVDLTLPSFAEDEDGNPTDKHNVCKVRIMDPVAMLAAGLLDDFDELTKISALKMQEVDGRSVPTADSIQQLAGMTDTLNSGLILVDRLVEATVVEPKVVWPVHRDRDGKPVRDKESGEWLMLGPDERDPEVLYCDDVDLEDRLYILQWAVGGTSDPEQFRKEYQGLLGSVEDGASLPLSALGGPWGK